MTQYVINIGAIPNDGTGDPLRTAFNETNLNFNQVFAAGPVLSNVRIANNTVLTTNTNGNLVLAANGTGVIQANVSVVPNLANLRNLGSALQRWNTVYTQYVDVSGPVSLSQLTVTGNLTVNGNIIQIGNLVTDAKTIQLANTAGTANAANGSGITVGANDNIATFLYTNAGNRWNTNIGLQVAGLANVNSLSVNQTANAWRIVGNTISAPSGATWNSNPEFLDEYITSALDGYINLISLYANGNTASQVHLAHGLAEIVVDNGSEYIWTFDDTGNLTLPGNTFAVNYANGTQVSLGGSYSNSNVTTLLSNLGSNTISGTGNITTTANISGGFIFGNIQAADGNTSVMFNQEGFLGADAGFSYNYSDNTLYVETVSILGKNSHGDNALYVGVTGFTPLGSNVVAQLAGNADSYTQVNFQNISNSPQASGDYIITANNGTDSSNFIDLGIAGNTWNGTQLNSLGNAVSANDGYLYVNGGNLVVGTYLNSGNVINTWKFGTDGNLTLPGATAGETIATSGGYITVGNLLIGQGGALFNSNNDSWALYGNRSDPGTSIFIPSDAAAGNGTPLFLENNISNVEIRSGFGTWNFETTGNLTAPGNVSAVGNVVGGNLIATGNIVLTGSLVGSGASPAPSLSGFSSVSAITVSASGNISATGNVTGGNILGNGAAMTGVAAKTTGTWTLVTGTNTVSLTVPLNGTYSIWVSGNIPNGIVVWNATVTVTNNNVPAIGQQFAWYYPAPGNALVLTSIPAQIIGTANTISNATPAVGTTTNVFEFTIDNNSGNSAVVDYGYTKIS
jgi:hypothetical protein